VVRAPLCARKAAGEAPSPTGLVAGQWLAANYPSTFEEYAIFTDLTYHITDRFDVQVGVRESENLQDNSSIQTGPYVKTVLGKTSPLVQAPLHIKADAFTYLLTPRFKISDNLMIYARLASGYRAGGPNAVAGVPPQYNPDTTKNYEVGAKGTFFDGLLTVDGSLYHIDWKNLQLSLTGATGGYKGNGGVAKSEGAEISVELRPWTGGTIGGFVSWNNAELTGAFPANSTVAGNPGDRLPFASRYNANLSVTQDFPITSDVTGFIGGSLSYVGDRKGVFRGKGLARQLYPEYTQVDLRAGVNYQDWSVNLFANNLSDERGLLDGGLGQTNAASFSVIQPRTVGLSVTRSF